MADLQADVSIDVGPARAALASLTSALQQAASQLHGLGGASNQAGASTTDLNETLRAMHRTLIRVADESQRTADGIRDIGNAAGGGGRGGGAGGQINTLARQFNQLQDAGYGLAGVGAALTAGITMPLVGLAQRAVEAGMTMQGFQMGMVAIMGKDTNTVAENARIAADEIERLKAVAALPGLGMQEAISGSMNLQAAGLSADQARASLMNFGNALAIVGKGKEDLAAVNLQFQQMLSRNQILAQDFNLIRARIPQMGKAFRDAFGGKSMEEVRRSGISAAEFIGRITEELAKLPSAGNSVRNQMETLGDRIFEAFAKIGEDLLPLVGWAVNQISIFVAKAVEVWSSFSKETKIAIGAVLGLVAVIGPLLALVGGMMIFAGSVALAAFALQAIGPIIIGLISPFLVWGAAIVAAGILILTFREQIVETFQIMWGVVEPAVTSMLEALQPFIDGLKVLGVIVATVIGVTIIGWWEILKVAVQATVMAITTVIRGLAMAIEGWANIIAHGLNLAVQGWINIFSWFKAALVAEWENIKEDSWEIVTGILRGIGAIFGAPEWAEGIISTISGWIDGIRSLATRWLQTGREFIQWMLDGIIAAMARVPFIGARVANTLAGWFHRNPVEIPVQVRGGGGGTSDLDLPDSAERQAQAAAAYAGVHGQGGSTAKKRGRQKSAEEVALDRAKDSATSFTDALTRAREAGEDTTRAVANIRTEMARIEGMRAPTTALQNQRRDIVRSLDQAILKDLEEQSKAIAEQMERTVIGSAEHAALTQQQAALERRIGEEATRRGVRTQAGAELMGQIEEIRAAAAKDVADETERTLARMERQARAGASTVDTTVRLRGELAEVERQLEGLDPYSETAEKLHQTRDQIQAGLSGFTAWNAQAEGLLNEIAAMPEEVRRNSEEGQRLQTIWNGLQGIIGNLSLPPELRQQARELAENIDEGLGALTLDPMQTGMEVITWEDFGKRIAQGLRRALPSIFNDRGAGATAEEVKAQRDRDNESGGYAHITERRRRESRGPNGEAPESNRHERPMGDTMRTFLSAMQDEFKYAVGLAHATTSAASRAWMLTEYTIQGFAGGVESIVGSIVSFKDTLVDTMRQFTDPMLLFAQSAGIASDVFGDLVANLNPLSILADVIGGAMSEMEPTMKAFEGPMKALGQVLNAVLAPIVERLAPVFQQLVPVIAIVAQILGILFEALMPIIEALVPLIKAMVPIFKFLAIIATYVGQVLAVLGGIIMHIGGAIAQAIGGLVMGIGRLIGKIPGLGGLGRDIRNFGRGIRDTGRAMRQMGDGMFESARELGEAREEIRNMELDETLGDVDAAAEDVSESLKNVPEGFKIERARWAAMDPSKMVTDPYSSLAATAGLPSNAVAGAITNSTVDNSRTTIGEVHLHGVEDPEENWRGIQRVIERDNAAGRIGPVPSGPQPATV